MKRRAFLGLGSISIGFGTLYGTGAFSSQVVSRGANIDVMGDEKALLGLHGFDSSVIYDEPHEVTVTNSTESTLDDNTVESTGDLRFRDLGTSDSSSNFTVSSLAPGESYTFEVVTGPQQTGEVTDNITLAFSNDGGISIVADRKITVRFDAGGQLVYAISGQINVYDAVNDNLITPAQTQDAEVVGANAVDIVDDSNADLPYLDNNSDIYATWAGASSDQAILTKNNLNLKKSKTRLSTGRWPPAENLSGDLILSADKNSKTIIGIDADGSTEELYEPENGCGGIAGSRDIDADGDLEIVFVDGSQQLRYLEQTGSGLTTQKIENASVGSNNSTGFGPPVEFDNGIEIPFIDGSNNPALVDYEGNKTVLNGTGPAKKAAVAPVDIDGDDEFEFMFLGVDEGKIRYIDDVGGTNTIKTLQINGSAVTPDEKIGLNSGARSD